MGVGSIDLKVGSPPLWYNHRCVRITDTGLSYLSTMSSLRSLYLRWCCQVPPCPQGSGN